MREPFPLQWPEGEPRTQPGLRARSRFGVRGQVSFTDALTDLRRELGRLGAVNEVITTDLPVRRDGMPRATDAERAGDPGVAVWFFLADPGGKHRERVLACDRWRTHAENMTALAKTIEAMRGLDRWGVAGAVTRVFAGFTALPPGDQGAPGEPPEQRARPWREVLGGAWPAELGAAEMLVIAKARHRALIAQHHPDRGGDPLLAAEINAALDQAEQELARG